MMGSQRSDALARPAIAMAGRQLIPIENARDQIIVRNKHQLSYGLDDVRRGAVALAVAPPGQSQFGVDTPHPMDDENDLGCFGVNVSNHLVDQRPNDALLEPSVGWSGPTRHLSDH